MVRAGRFKVAFPSHLELAGILDALNPGGGTPGPLFFSGTATFQALRGRATGDSEVDLVDLCGATPALFCQVAACLPLRNPKYGFSYLEDVEGRPTKSSVLDLAS